MAEQYASFQGKEPNIDVNLFVNALTQGIAAGNAQKGIGSAIAQGIQGGVQFGINTVQGIQQIQANANALDPEVVAAKKEIAVAQGAKAQTENEIQSNNRAAIEAAEAFKISQARDASAIAAEDAASKLQLNDLLKTANVDQQTAVFQDKNFAGYFGRNPAEAQAYIQGVRSQGGNPAVLDPLQKQYSELDYANRSRSGKQATQTLAAKAAEQDQVDAGRFQNTLSAIPEADPYLNADDKDYRKFNYAPSKTVNKSTGTSPYYDLRYGDDVIKANSITKDEFAKANKELTAWIATNVHATGPVPESIARTGSATPAVEPTIIEDQGLGLAAGQQQSQPTFQERDITAEANEKLSTPILKGAVTVGGFTRETVEKNIPAFNAVGKAINQIIKSSEPNSLSNEELLTSTVQLSAKRISKSAFDSDPSLQASYTMTDVNTYNDNLKFFGQGADTANQKFKDILQGLRVNSPEELYFVNNGAGYVQQLDKYARQVLLANKQNNELQRKRAARNATLQAIGGK